VLRAVSPLVDRPRDVVAAATPLGPVAAFFVRPYRLDNGTLWKQSDGAQTPWKELG